MAADPTEPKKRPVLVEVGSRCVCEGCYGTVRYVGEVPPAKGVWVGVEWDDLSRGKHSGEHEGVQYFTCRTPGSGSFVRPKKISLGCTFIEALKERYGGESPWPESEEDDQMYIVSGGHRVKPVEMVGAEKVTKKQSQYDQLLEISLRGMLISSAGTPGEIRAIAPNIRYLDLSKNLLLSNWTVVANICSQLQHLKILKLSLSGQTPMPVMPAVLLHICASTCQVSLVALPLRTELKFIKCFHYNENRSLPLLANPAPLIPAFSCLKQLFINQMDLSWNQVCSILKVVPNLEELHVFENKIANLCPPDDVSLPMSLQLLNLEENHLSDWSDVLRLQHLPLLKTLILNDNQLTQILQDADSQSSINSFPALESLSLNRNHIADWSSLNALAILPSLVELKFKGNPLLEGEPAFAARQLVIARIGQLTFLNSSPITDRERQLAERYYLKRYASEWVSLQVDETSRKQFSALHPRYTHLTEVHGLPEEVQEAQKPSASALRDRLIAVTVKCPDHPDQKQLTKKLPGTMTIQKVKGLLQRMYRVNSSDQRLSYVHVDKQGEREIEMSDDLKQLSFYSIETGDTILLRW